MPAFAIALPLLEGKETMLKQFSEELRGPRLKTFDESEHRLGIPKEYWFLQRSPGGNLVIVTFESPDPARTLTEFGQSRDPFDVWFKSEVKEITGVDLNGPLPPPPEELIHYER